MGVLAALGIAVVLVGIIAVGSATNGTTEEAAADSTGDAPPAERAPDFAVTLFDGSRFRLSEHLAEDGRPVFLNLWASWCPPCRAEMPDLSAAAEMHPEVRVIGVAVEDDPAAARAFAESLRGAYPVGADLDGSVDRAYPAPGLPATYVIDAEGVVRATVYGQVTGRQIEEMLAENLG
jgi:thiol-disulfide isomerase/thioredoxin